MRRWSLFPPTPLASATPSRGPDASCRAPRCFARSAAGWCHQMCVWGGRVYAWVYVWVWVVVRVRMCIDVSMIVGFVRGDLPTHHPSQRECISPPMTHKIRYCTWWSARVTTPLNVAAFTSRSLIQRDENADFWCAGYARPPVCIVNLRIGCQTENLMKEMLVLMQTQRKATPKDKQYYIWWW